MSQRTFSHARRAIPLSALLLLASCGGGGGGGIATPADPLVPGSEVPQSATTSADGAFAFVSGVAASTDDTAEPLVVGDAELATTDTEEPKAF